MTTSRPASGAKTDRLKALMAEFGLSSADVASLTGKALKTVYGWRIGHPYAIPDNTLRLLELDLRQGLSSPHRGGASLEDPN
jgi:hypothetical protein